MSISEVVSDVSTGSQLGNFYGKTDARFQAQFELRDSGVGVASRATDRAPLTSGLPHLADFLRIIQHVSKVPRTEVAS